MQARKTTLLELWQQMELQVRASMVDQNDPEYITNMETMFYEGMRHMFALTVALGRECDTADEIHEVMEKRTKELDYYFSARAFADRKERVITERVEIELKRREQTEAKVKELGALLGVLEIIEGLAKDSEPPTKH